MRNKTANDRLLEIACIFLLAVLPLLIFLKNGGYSVVAAEVLVIVGLILVFAVLCGLMIVLGRRPAYLVILTALAVLVVDVQTDWITTLGLRLLLTTVFFGTLFWFVRRHLTQMIVIGVSLMVIVTVMLPGTDRVRTVGEPAARVTDNADLPFILHLIVDAHIGIEAIPATFDRQGELAADFRTFFLDNSFQVFGRAYSRYYDTRESIPNTLNFATSSSQLHFLGGTFQRGMLLPKNRWFDLLHERGYRIHVTESDYLRYYAPAAIAGDHNKDTLYSYPWASIKPIETADLTVQQKIPFILSTYFKRSWLLSLLAPAYTDFAFSDRGVSLHLPLWDLQGGYPGALAAMQAMDVLTETLRHAGPGQAYFAHIMLPHSPFGYTRDCAMETRPGRWLKTHNDQLAAPHYNTLESRALRYPLYLDQVVCLQSRLEAMFQILKEKGLWERATIIIHGDHGPRLCQWRPNAELRDKLTPADYIDCFPTLFAIKGADIEPGYDRRLLPVDHLFRRFARDAMPPGDQELQDHPWVYLNDGSELMIKEPLPLFAKGRIQGGNAGEAIPKVP